MKSSRLFSLAFIATLAMSTMAFAAGQGGARSGVSASGTLGTQTRIHTPGTGLTTGTPTQTRIHTPGTGIGTATPASGQAQQGARQGGGQGIHTPGTGLTTPAVVPPAN